MKVLRPLDVELHAISDKTSEPAPSAKETDAMAESIIACGGILQPAIVQEVGFNEYVLLAGKAQFLAVQKAAKIDPEIEHIQAFVAESAEEAEALLSQHRLWFTPRSVSN